jgi:hypothetical protein
MAGSAMRAENQWSRSRVAAPMPWACPAHTAMDKSITLPAANPATAMALSSSRSRFADSVPNRAGSKGTRR